MPLMPDVPYRHIREGRVVARGVDRGDVADNRLNTPPAKIHAVSPRHIIFPIRLDRTREARCNHQGSPVTPTTLKLL